MKKIICGLSLILMLALTACGSEQQEKPVDPDKVISEELTYDHSLELENAEKFSVDYYEDDFVLLSVDDEGKFLIVPEKKEAPEDLEEGIKVIQGPVDNIYLVATATMDMFRSMDAIDKISLSGTEVEKWYIPEAREAMEEGKIEYAGKYSAPDYEKILDTGCDLSIQSTMVLRAPEVMENLEEFGIPVIVDHSSYEKDPEGRMEWIKFYGALVGKDEEAKEAFDEQKQSMKEVRKEEKTGKTVAFFNITSKGLVNVRKPNDYIAQIIEIAGGDYIFDDISDGDESSTTMNMQLEEFYAGAKDADYIIYNSTIDGGVQSIEELTAKNEMLKDFKAVQEGHAFCTTQSLYQDSMKLGDVTEDFHKMMTMEEDDDEELDYMFRLK